MVEDKGKLTSLTTLVTTQAQNQGYKLAHPDITPSIICAACEVARPADPKLQDLYDTEAGTGHPGAESQ